MNRDRALGFTHPLAEPDYPVMDDLAKQLGDVETNAENIQHRRPGPEMVKDSNEPDEQEEEEKTSPPDDYETPEVKNHGWGTFQNSLPLPQEGAGYTQPPNPPFPRPPRKGGGSIQPRRRLPLRVRLPGSAGRTIGGVNSYLRFCPENHEIIDTQQCENCEKPLPKNEWPRKRSFRWAVRWFGSDGKRYSKSFKTRKEAERFAESKQSEIRNGKTDPPEAIELEEFSKVYIEIRGDLRPSTMREHSRTLGFLQDYFGPKHLVKRITPLDARRFVSWFRRRKSKGQPIAAATVNKVIRECRRIFREAVDCELIGSNPFVGIRKQKIGQTEWHYISPNEYWRLIKACPSLRWQGMVTIAYCCGLRRSELLNLTWSDVDFEKGRLRVVRKQADVGKVEWTPKDKDMRILPLSKEVLTVLTSLHSVAAEGQVYVFVNTKGPARGCRIKKQNVWRDFQAIRVRAGLPKCSLRDLRKSYCTNMAAVLPMHVVKQITGHSDMWTTRRYYLCVHPGFFEDARKAVEAVLRT